jgi:elongation factor Ts
LEISTDRIKELREQSGAGVMACRQALIDADGNIEKAIDLLKEQGLLAAKKKAERTADQGLVESYIHTAGRIGAMVEVNCETDFVARTDEFKALAHEIAMQVAAICPQVISPEEVEDLSEEEQKTACLLLQPHIKDPARTVQDLVNDAIARTGENIKISRFVRFELGETGEQESA